jgi:hypothetical protein
MEQIMSDDTQATATLAVLRAHVDDLAAEVATLRESIVTAAEWDAEARRARQLALDSTLATVRRWLRVLVAEAIVLLLLALWLAIRVGLPR